MEGCVCRWGRCAQGALGAQCEFDEECDSESIGCGSRLSSYMGCCLGPGSEVSLEAGIRAFRAVRERTENIRLVVIYIAY